MFPTERVRRGKRNRTGERKSQRPRKLLGNLRSGSNSFFGRLQRPEKNRFYTTQPLIQCPIRNPQTPSYYPSRPLRRLELIVHYAHPSATQRRRQLRRVPRNNPCLRSACYKRTHSAQPLYRFLFTWGAQHQRPFRGHDLERVLGIHPSSPLAARVRRLWLISDVF